MGNLHRMMLIVSFAECPPCYSSIQEDVHLLRAKIPSMQLHFSTLMNHPAMLHNHTFVERLRRLVAEVSGLTQSINAALELESNSTSQWLQFAVVVNDLSARLNQTIATSVNDTLQYTVIVDSNRRETETTVKQIQDVITEASRLLDTPMRLELEQAEVRSRSLARVAGQMMDLTQSIVQEENRTLLANETIHARVEYVMDTANITAEKARNATDTQAEVAAMLRPLYENASAVNVLGEKTVAMVSEKLAAASKAYNDSLEMLNEARRANPDRSSVSCCCCCFFQLFTGGYQFSPTTLVVHQDKILRFSFNVLNCLSNRGKPKTVAYPAKRYLGDDSRHSIRMTPPSSVLT